MPASSFGAINSWAVYLFAAAALVLLFTPQLVGVARTSRAAADWRDLDGVRAIVDSLRPGIQVRFSFGVARFSDDIALEGHTVSCFVGNGTISMKVLLALPNATLGPAVRYSLSLVGGVVRVGRDG